MAKNTICLWYDKDAEGLPAFTPRAACRNSHVSTSKTRGMAISDGEPMERCGNSISCTRG